MKTLKDCLYLHLKYCFRNGVLEEFRNNGLKLMDCVPVII